MSNRYSRRQLRGLGILAIGRQIARISDSAFQVKSQSGVEFYCVRLRGADRSCECEDYLNRLKPCKHVYAVEFFLRLPAILEANSGTTFSTPKSLPRPRMTKNSGSRLND